MNIFVFWILSSNPSNLRFFFILAEIETNFCINKKKLFQNFIPQIYFIYYFCGSLVVISKTLKKENTNIQTEDSLVSTIPC